MTSLTYEELYSVRSAEEIAFALRLFGFISEIRTRGSEKYVYASNNVPVLSPRYKSYYFSKKNMTYSYVRETAINYYKELGQREKAAEIAIALYLDD